MHGDPGHYSVYPLGKLQYALWSGFPPFIVKPQGQLDRLQDNDAQNAKVGLLTWSRLV